MFRKGERVKIHFHNNNTVEGKIKKWKKRYCRLIADNGNEMVIFDPETVILMVKVLKSEIPASNPLPLTPMNVSLPIVEENQLWNYLDGSKWQVLEVTNQTAFLANDINSVPVRVPVDKLTPQEGWTFAGVLPPSVNLDRLPKIKAIRNGSPP